MSEKAASRTSVHDVVRRPVRYQLSRKKGSRLPSNIVCVTRPGSWGNPYETAYDFRRVLELILDGRFTQASLEEPVLAHMKRIADNLEKLRGKDLACWCSLGHQCHADVLLEMANR